MQISHTLMEVVPDRLLLLVLGGLVADVSAGMYLSVVAAGTAPSLGPTGPAVRFISAASDSTRVVNEGVRYALQITKLEEDSACLLWLLIACMLACLSFSTSHESPQEAGSFDPTL